MRVVYLRINSGAVRHSPHDGIPCSDIRVPVTLTSKPPVIHNGKKLVTIVDMVGEEHQVDEFFIQDEFWHSLH